MNRLKNILIHIQQDATLHSLFYLETALHVSLGTAIAAGSSNEIPDAVDRVVCAPDDGWWYHPKHVLQFPDKINNIRLHLVGYALECCLTYFSKCLSMRFSPVPMENQ
jgi:hypothetical protein